MTPEDVTLTTSQAEDFVDAILRALGVVADEARLVATTLVQSEARGVPSHGLLRLSRYVDRFRQGFIVSPCPMRVVRETDSTLAVDGGLGWGQVIAARTMERCIEKARQTGACLASVRNANHFGAAAYYARLATRAGMIGIAMAASGEAGDGICVAPWGGYVPLFDTNPIAVALPGGPRSTVVLDMATTAVSQGRLRVNQQRGEAIPEGWALDTAGNPTTDPSAGLAGTMLPLGGYKGYGLGIVVDLLCRLLPGAPYPHTPNDGQFFAAIGVGAFQDLETFQSGLDGLAEAVRTAPRRPGFDEILLPGERARRSEERAADRGVLVAGQTWTMIVALARNLGVAPPV